MLRYPSGMAIDRGEQSGVDAHPIIPLARERLTIGRRRVDVGRVIVRTKTEIDRVVVDEVVERDDIRIERAPVDRFIDEPAPPRYEGDTLVIPVIEEVLVVTRRLRLVEEVRITPRVVHRRHRETVPVRRQRVEVERRATSGANPTNARRKP